MVLQDLYQSRSLSWLHKNPVEYEGTYSLPEAQLDRFLLKLKMGYPTPEEEFEILNRMEKQIHSLNYRPLLQ